jgi:hypothetical protein
VINADDFTDLSTVADDLQPDQLVVVPGIWFFRKNFYIGVYQQNRLDKGLGGVAVIHVLKKQNRLSVVIAEFLDGNGLAEPRRSIWNLQVEDRASFEPSLRTVGI